MVKNRRAEYISFRVSPKIKKILRDIAEKEFRTLSQQAEKIVHEWLKANKHIKG